MRWNTKEELLPILENANTLHSGVPILCEENGNTWLDTSENHIAVVGLTGCGKTRRVLLPLVWSIIRAGESALVLDSKGDIYRETATFAKENGYKMFLVDCRNKLQSNSYNPLKYIFDLYRRGDTASLEQAEDQLDCFARALVPKDKDPFWYHSSVDLLKGIVYILLKYGEPDEVNLSSVHSILTNANKLVGMEPALKSIAETFREGSSVRNTLSSYVGLSARETQSCIASYLSAALNQLTLSEVTSAFLAGDDINIACLNEKNKILLYVIVPDENASFFNVAATLINQFAQHFIARACQNGGRLKKRVNVVVDELSNIAPCLHDCFPQLMSASRSRNIRVCFATQSKVQLEAYFSPPQCETIFDNAETQFFFRVKSEKTMNELVRRCGERKIDYGWHVSTEPVISAEGISSLKKGQAIIFVGDRKIVSQLRDWSEYRPGQSKAPARPCKERTLPHPKVFDIIKCLQERKRQELFASLDAAGLEGNRPEDKSEVCEPKKEEFDFDQLLIDTLFDMDDNMLTTPSIFELVNRDRKDEENETEN